MSNLKALRAELGHFNELLADARSREVTAVLARFRDEVELLGITEPESRRALGYDWPAPAPANYYDPATGRKWSGRGQRPAWLAGKRLEDYAIDAPRSQLCGTVKSEQRGAR
jgi:DNA-binding protein H-NS